MKRAALVAVVVLAVVAALPWLTGRLTESHVRERLARMSDNPIVVAELRTYERGWFSSTAKVDVGLSPQYLEQLSAGGPAPGVDLLEQRLPVHVGIRHGPLVVGDGVHFGTSTIVARSDPDAPLAATLRDQYGMPYIFELRGRAGFGGGFDFDADVPSVDYGDGTNEIAFSGAVVEGTLDGDHLVAEGSVARFDQSGVFVTTLIENVRMTGDYELRPNDFALGDARLDIERVVISSALLGADPVFSANGLRFDGSIALDEATTALSIATGYGAQSLTAGAGFALTDADLRMTIAGLDATAMRDYYGVMQGAMGAPADAETILLALEPVLLRLLGRGPSLVLDPVRFSMNGAPVTARVRVEVDPAAVPPGRADFQNPGLWLAIATVTADAEVAKPLVEQAAAQFVRMQLAAVGAGTDEPLSEDELDVMAEAQAGFLLVTLTGQGFLEDSGESYTTEARFAAGELTVNGTPVPLALQ